MIKSKHLAAITAVLMSLCLVFCGVIVYAADVLDAENSPEYASKLFGGEILTIDIQVDADEWQEAMDNATAKEWVSGDVVINGETFAAVGVRTKGNSSLTQMSGSGSNRYSLHFEFNRYVKGQTCYGLDTFCVNNMSGDATYMKDYMSYEIMRFIGVDAPLTNYAQVTVNGEYYGFGVALERYDKAYLDRTQGTSGGNLYNVKIQMGMREDFEAGNAEAAAGIEANPAQQDAGNFPARPQNGAADESAEEEPADRSFGRGNMGGMGGGFGGMGGGFGGMGGGGGGSLVYTDDEISSYGSIFDNPVFGSTSEKDNKRTIEAIKNLNEGNDLEKYIDVDAALRYFAAHTVVVNLDSYVSNMQQNYYLYEKNGQLTILPWDYGLAFGGFMSGDASSAVNFPIDTPVSGTTLEDRPLLGKLLEVEEYKERYHQYLLEIVEGYFESGLYEETIRALDAKISGYVKNDTTAYVTYDAYQAAVEALIQFGELRAQSIRGQLEGTIPSTTQGQAEDSSSLVDASSLNVSAMGSMGGGNRGGGERPTNMAGREQTASAEPSGGESEAPPGEGDPSDETAAPAEPGGMFGGFGGPGGGDMPDMAVIQQAMEILTEANFELTDEVKAQLLELGITEEQIEMFAGMTEGGGRQMAGMGGFSGFGTSESSAEDTLTRTQYVILLGVLAVLVIAATAFIVWPRKSKI